MPNEPTFHDRVRALYEDAIRFSAESDTPEQLARRLFFRHDPDWRAFLANTREMGLGSRAPIESPQQVEQALLRLASVVDPSARDILANTSPGKSFMARNPWVRELPEEIQAVYRRLYPDLDWTRAGPTRPTLAELLRAARESATAFADQRRALLDAFHSWLDVYANDAEAGNWLEEGGEFRVFMNRVRIAADVFRNLTPGPGLHAFFDHFICETDLVGPRVTVGLAFSPWGERAVAISITSPRLTNQLVSELPDDFAEFAPVFLAVMGDPVREDDLFHAGRAQAIVLLMRLVDWYSPPDLKPTQSGAARLWNATAPEDTKRRIDLRNVSRAVRTHGAALNLLVRQAVDVYEMTGAKPGPRGSAAPNL